MSKFTKLRQPAIFISVACCLAAALHFPTRQPEELSGKSVPPPPPPPPVAKAPSPTTQNVLLAVSGLKQQACPVLAAVFLNADGFPKVESASSTVRHESDNITDHVELTLQLPKHGTAAIAVFQDLDANGVLTKNALGLPVEPYGFSKNARATFGPPAFTAAAIDLANAPEKLEVQVR